MTIIPKKTKIWEGKYPLIRAAKQDDIDKLMQIWLNTNIQAHNFVPQSYWENHFDKVKEMLPLSTIYVYENQKEIQGFIGLTDDYIAGIFVCNHIQSTGIGKQLLDYIKNKKDRLTLTVYQKNTRAVKFYQRENFKIQSKNMDEHTGEREFFMLWERL